MVETTLNADGKSNVKVLKEIVALLKKNKLIVALAYRLNYTTPTIYGWNNLSDDKTDDKKALDYLLQISQIDRQRILEDGPVMGQIIDFASSAVGAAISHN